MPIPLVCTIRFIPRGRGGECYFALTPAFGGIFDLSLSQREREPDRFLYFVRSSPKIPVKLGGAIYAFSFAGDGVLWPECTPQQQATSPPFVPLSMKWRGGYRGRGVFALRRMLSPTGLRHPPTRPLDDNIQREQNVTDKVSILPPKARFLRH